MNNIKNDTKYDLKNCAKEHPAVLIKDVTYSYARAKVAEDFAAPKALALDSSTTNASAKDSSSSNASSHDQALAGVSLNIQPGEFIALLGANGSGKSTLARHINALLAPTTGKVLVCGMDTAAPELLFSIRSCAGMVFQNPDSQIVAGVVADDVAFGPENLCVEHDSIIARVNEALSDVGMSEFARREPMNLSGGQKQRVCIAGIMAMQPQILVLDEPGAMLDQRGRRGIRRVMGELHAAGMTVILITHYMEEAALADRIVVLERGSVVVDGTPREVFKSVARLREPGLGLPFSVLLAEELRLRGIDIPATVRPRELRAHLLSLSKEMFNMTLRTMPDKEFKPKLLHQPRLQPKAQAKSLSQSQQQAQPSRSPQSLSAISLNQVSYYYPEQENPALNNINLEITQGSLTAIIGHSGSGKSTLMQLICGLEQPSSGKISILGSDLAIKKVCLQIHKKVAIAFQYPEHQLFAATVAGDVAFAPKNAGLPEQQVEQIVREALNKLALDYDSFAMRSPFSLSGGEKRRVALAGVLAQDAEVVIFDEPTTGLDPQTHDLVLQMISDLHESGKTVILVTHDIDDVALLAERIIVLSQGEVMLDGDPRMVFAHAQELRDVNLGVPQATQFAIKLAAESKANAEFAIKPALNHFGALANQIVLSTTELANAIVNCLGGDAK
ncbi:MAG: energy-coupling factor transporter ATPase [Coriobacteriales bacterium]|jgi:energy-coupling factor transport system ATP-binding protein|nr:energy-coupling factor transporter ATPase [Coriobacteriales bacterium]